MRTPKNAGALSRMTSTSSEYISPSTRRIQSKRSSSHTPTFVNVSENDDAAERRQRRRSKVLELQRQLQSPATPTERRRSLPLYGLTTDQLTEHYSSCIKLSAENKINAKNAFGLHLIDYMSEMLKEKMGELTNFQMASCTLDAGAKIYAGRVDAVHADTYKVLSGLGHGDKQTRKDDQEEGDVAKTTKKKKVRQGNTVVTNLNTITANKVDVEFEVDPLFQKTAAAFDEGGTFSLLLNHLPVRDDSCELLLDSSCVIDNVGREPEEVKEKQDTTVDLSEIRGHYSSVHFEALQICPAFTDFEFSNWSQNGENAFSEVFAKMAQSEKAFDINSVPEPIEDDHPVDDYGPDHFNGGDYSDDDSGGGTCGSDHFSLGESVFVGDDKEAQMITEHRNGMTMASTKDGNLCLQLALQPGEYSYFKPNAFTMWAGPEHWKVKPFSKEPGEKKDDGVKKAKKPAFKLDYDQDVDFSKYFSTSKAATTLSKVTLDKNKKTQTTLPEDLHYHPDTLFKLFLKPSFMVKRQAIETSEGMDDGIEGYDYNNENDCANFCPAMDAEDDDFDDDVGGGGDCTAARSDCSSNLFQSSVVGDDSIFDTTAFSGDKLVSQPHRVAKIDVPYAKTAKRMDVKKLKSAMWKLLTYENIVENEKNQNEERKEDKVTQQKSFKEMYSTLPREISKNMSKNLSVPIAFVCLLHLCNEKNLIVSTKGNMDDLNIIQTNVEKITPT
ncbi:condensin complex subunit 2-like isoform X2 [Anneissia japonica]|uniref:condensin complex subunit 2-like isoform X2 n=1 Tax=Anneissia japonica TaxID=1529436 RepID=UPI00142577EB|nr:condensin complex subunit 2-like isoform X2 [Anneissia japonica]